MMGDDNLTNIAMKAASAETQGEANKTAISEVRDGMKSLDRKVDERHRETTHQITTVHDRINELTLSLDGTTHTMEQIGQCSKENGERLQQLADKAIDWSKPFKYLSDPKRFTLWCVSSGLVSMALLSATPYFDRILTILEKLLGK